MDSISGYKDRALASLKGRWDKAAVAILIVGLFIYLPSLCIGLVQQGLDSLWTIVALPLNFGIAVFFLALVRNQDLQYGQLFDGYRDFSRIFLTELLKTVYIGLWSILLFVPGIIKSYSYAMTDFILKDRPELKNNAAIEESMVMMEGHKMDLFLLDLSFIGWALLSFLTLGLGFFLLVPYVQTAHTHFYEDLKRESQWAVQ